MTTDNTTISRAALEKTVKALLLMLNYPEARSYLGRNVCSVADAAITEARAAMDAQGESEEIAAFARGFYCAAEWAKRPDLYTDIGSPAYIKDVELYLGIKHPQATEPAPKFNEERAALFLTKNKLQLHNVLAQPAPSPSAQSSNPSGEHSEPSLLGSEPAPSTVGERVSPEVLRLRQQLDGITANLESYRERFNIAMKNCDRYTDRIAELEAAQSTQRERSESAISLHDAWLYFTGAEPSLSRLGQAIDQASALLQSTADHIGDANKMVAALPDPQLCKFYGVETYPELVTHMLHHIEKLQAKLPPTSDEQPGKARFA